MSALERRLGTKQRVEDSNSHPPFYLQNILSFLSYMYSQMVVQSFLEEDREDHEKEMEEQIMLKEVKERERGRERQRICL